MENYWIFYSIWWLLVLWLWDFIKKVIIQKWANKEVFLFVCFVFYIIFLWWNFLLNWSFNFTNVEIKSAIIIWIFDSMIPLWVLTAFKYLEISFALIFMRIISSVVILFIWMKILWDNLNTANIIWFLMWIVAIYLLSGFNFWKKHKISKKWIIALLATTIAIIWSHSYFKYYVADLNIDNFMILKFIVSFSIIILYMIIRWKFSEFSRKQIKLVLPLSIITAILFTAQFLYFMPNIYLNWPLSLSYKILSYSLIVPIILSIILYKDKITKRKIIAFVLTLFSLGLFII